jgi:predicted DNA-binding protein (MmcQ/YjbR family)
MSFPHVTEQVQWGNDLVFKVGGKMFAVAPLDPAENWLSFKADPEVFAELVERIGVVPAPYMARAHWVALQGRHAMPLNEVQERLRTAYDLVLAKLPKKARAALDS